MNTLSLSVSKPRSEKRQPSAHALNPLHNQVLVARHQGNTLRPSGCDIGQDKTVDKAAGHNAAAVCYKIRLHKARRRIVPVGEGPHRDASPERGGDASAAAPAVGSFAHLEQHPVDGGRADSEKVTADVGIRVKMPVLLDGLQ
jgi:hypothetical protein